MARSSSPNPPYIAVKKVNDLLYKVSSRSYDKIDRKVLMDSYGYSDGEASQAVGALAFLGIVNSDKSVNKEVVDSISAKNDEKRRAGLENMVRTAYEKLFDAYPEASSAETDDIYDEMKRVYDLSPRITSTAVPVFVSLCELAGLRAEPQDKPTSTPEPKKLSQGTKTQSPPANKHIQNKLDAISGSSSLVIDFAGGKIKLALPQEILTSPSLIDGYKSLLSELNNFVASYESTLADKNS